MEGLVKKYQQKFKKVKEEMGRWDELQCRLLSHFINASAIIQRLQIIQDARNFGMLQCVEGIEDAVLSRQMGSLQTILLSMDKILEEFGIVVQSLEKIARESGHLVKGGSLQLTGKQLKQRVGVKPTIADCLDGLRLLHEMHHSEYRLKMSVVSALSVIALKPRTAVDDLGDLHRLLADQPNIPSEEVQFIFDIIFAEEIS